MTEDRSPKASETTAVNVAGKQRKKRKWDQPAESLISAAVALSGPATLAAVSPPLIPPNASAIVQKLIQPKIQDELIAREIVINDADPSVRYKLTKRQTQEEIQKCTRAVVITRGKYRPPNGIPDGEKPLYLHISAGSHLKDTVERIKAVDRAACMVEEMLKQGQNSLATSTILQCMLNKEQATQSLSTCLYLGFNPDPSVNIANRIRGPNDQYINHIMTETGATVELRGQGSGNLDKYNNEEAQQPLHLFLSASNPKSLENARILAENLLDTICTECGASRISSCKVYGAVPPPQQLLAGVSSENTTSTFTSLTSTPATLALNGLVVGSSTCSLGSAQPDGLNNYGNPPQNTVTYAFPAVSGGTSYIGYGGIYPQATPLQQVALALRQAPSTTTSVPASTSQAIAFLKPTSSSSSEIERRPSQKRKFQELPVSSKGPTMPHKNLRQESEFLKPGLADSSAKDCSSMPPPKKLVLSGPDGMLPPLPPRSMPLLPSPKFVSAKAEIKSSAVKKQSSEVNSDTISKHPSSGPLSDILLKLVEYGEEEDDIDGATEDYHTSKPTDNQKSKPFWAV